MVPRRNCQMLQTWSFELRHAGAMYRIVLLLLTLCLIRVALAGAAEEIYIELSTRLDTGGDLTGSCTIGFNGFDPLQGKPVIEREIWLSSIIGSISESLIVFGIQRHDPVAGKNVAGATYDLQFRAERFAAVNDSTIDFRLPSAALIALTGEWQGMEVTETLTLPKRYQIVGNPIPIDTTCAAVVLQSEGEIRSKLLQVRHRISYPATGGARLPSVQASALRELLNWQRHRRILGIR